MAAAGPRLSDPQRLAWLRLIRSEHVGPITFRELVNRFGSAAAALDALPDLARRGGRLIGVCPTADAERELAALAAKGGQFIALGEPGYPPWLREIDSAPPLLAVRGDAAILQRPAVAVIGSRNASAAGRKLAAMIARDLGAVGFVVVSGLARGIDAAAQEAALARGTVAVLAGGLDRIYPEDNLPLAEAILGSGGAHVTEMAMGWQPRAQDFPRRNRIISGLAVGVVIVEAADRSGSLITARFAGEQGRIVFAIPGSPLDPRAAGTNRLLKDGAILVTSADDIIPVLRPMIGDLPPASGPLRERERPPAEPEPPANDRARVIEALGPAPIEIDEIVRSTGLGSASVQLVLIELDLAGRIERHPGQRVSLL